VAELAVWLLRVPPDELHLTPELDESFPTLAVSCNGSFTVTPPRIGDNVTEIVEAAPVRVGALAALQPATPIAKQNKTLTGSGIRIRQSSSFSYNSFGIGVDRKRTAKWRFHQENGTSDGLANST
jgi:hypothetical protein